MIKSIKAILAQDKEKFKVPRKVQDLIPIKNIWPDGIFKVGNKFSKSFRFSDINYLVASREDKESMRKQIQEKLIKFATRIPIFMYLTDYRERTLKDVITQLEPGLFKKVTGLDVPDFEMLCTLGVFNASLMNDAIFKFKRYEDSSLSYTGVDKHEGMDVGGWDTVLKKVEY